MIRRTAVAAFAFIAILATTSAVAHAEGARPPIGHWVGTFQDGSTVELLLQANGSFMYGPTGYTPTVGTASWNPSYAGGILTLTYYNAGMETRAYYSVIWVNESTITFSDPYFKVVMKRR